MSIDLRTGLALACSLAAPGGCAGCREPGRVLCPTCRSLLVEADGRRTCPSPPPPGLPPLWCAHAYAGVVRAALLAHKERSRLALTGPLGRSLASAVEAAVGPTGRLLIVPAPSRASERRRRGFDHARRLAAVAAREVGRTRPAGSVQVLSALRHRRKVADQHGLGAQDRTSNLSGALRVRPGAVPVLRRAAGAGVVVVVVDDVVTSGATLTEATRALRAAAPGLTVRAAVVAATQRNGTRWRQGLPSGPPTY